MTRIKSEPLIFTSTLLFNLTSLNLVAWLMEAMTTEAEGDWSACRWSTAIWECTECVGRSTTAPSLPDISPRLLLIPINALHGTRVSPADVLAYYFWVLLWLLLKYTDVSQSDFQISWSASSLWFVWLSLWVNFYCLISPIYWLLLILFGFAEYESCCRLLWIPWKSALWFSLL